MIIRELEMSDIPAIDKIYHRQSIGVPSLANSVANRVVINGNGEIVAYGVLKLFAEAVLILDQTVNKKSKVEVLRELMRLAIESAKDRGLEQLYTISNGESFTKILCKKYNFRSCPGDLLMLDLEGIEDGQ